MDKKPSVRSGQGPAKGSCTESKKTQDTTNGKQFLKSGRKRETAGSNGTKYDQNRKPIPQKSKALDKRPKPRGFYYGGGKENSQIKDDEINAEFGSIFAIGSKKQSLNHLLNFHYEPRGENMPKRAQQTQHGCSTKSLMATQAHKYNKEQFLQANCQFVVREGGDYTFNLGDPDLLVDWDLVELIVIGSVEKVVCPICLYPPVAGKITRCGHVYCWSCILHYLALSDKSWRKCPICYEAIHKKDLRSVECIEKKPFSVGDTITLQLMKREKRTLVAMPVEQFNLRASKPILSYGDKKLETVYSKLLAASKQTVIDIINQEYAELQSKVEEYRGCPELCFVEQALALLAERKNAVMDQTKEITNDASASLSVVNEEISDLSRAQDKDTELVQNTDSNATSMEPNEKSDVENLNKCKRSESESTCSEGEEAPNINAEDLEIGNQNSSNNLKYFYFYQASDGQQIYLHSINVRTLEACYGSLEQCPQTISGRIVEKEAGSMTPQLRKRLRYLEHVPITCQFEVIELDLRPPVVTPEALARFQDQIDDRRRRRQRQARKEKKWEQRVEEAELLRYHRRPTPNLRIESLFHFPQCGLEEAARSAEMSQMPPMVHSPSSSRSVSPVNMMARNRSPLSSAVAALSLEEDTNSGPSFAQMLKDGKGIGTHEAWPTIGSSTSNTATAAASGWPRRQRQASVTQDYMDSDNDSAFSPPARPSFNIAEAIQIAASMEKGDNNSGGGGRKKKKKQQKILFSTGFQKGN